MGRFFDLDGSFLGCTVGIDNLLRPQLITEKPQYLTILDHSMASLSDALTNISLEVVETNCTGFFDWSFSGFLYEP